MLLVRFCKALKIRLELTGPMDSPFTETLLAAPQVKVELRLAFNPIEMLLLLQIVVSLIGCKIGKGSIVMVPDAGELAQPALVV